MAGEDFHLEADYEDRQSQTGFFPDPYDGDEDPEGSSPTCPACGDYIEYCQGHGEMGDPSGANILRLHDEDNHTLCVGEDCDGR